ncbi:MAG: lactate 2-monooxygenase [Solirubrobacteraceae bacterium]|nr:MAG: alpha-hydroxy-acid oxidizing enzyme [Solirubrobacterales bacterium]
MSDGSAASAAGTSTDAEVFANYQYEIYARGMSGERPRLALDWRELERRAEQVAPRAGWGYVAGGAGSEDTVRENRAAFGRWRIVPRMLRDVSVRDLRRTVLGTPLRAPVLLAPVGVQTLMHPEGELAVARAAASVGVPLVASTAASHTFEAIAEAAGELPLWYQLYWPRERELAASFIGRAEAAGYRALVVTLDTWMLGWRPRDLSEGFLPFLRGEGNVNFLEDPVFRGLLERPPEEDMQAAIGQWAFQFSNPSVTWADLAWLRGITELPIVLKGIQHRDDARLAVEHGADGIIVSNHGGRQVDGAIASLDALPGVVDEVGERCAVLFDSGVRGGSDAVKALALGARAVLLGRPYMWALALGGEVAVREYLRAFLADFDLALALSGHAGVDEVGPGSVVRRP